MTFTFDLKVNLTFTFIQEQGPNFVFGNQILNLVACVTTSISEVGDRKFPERKILNFQYQNWPTEEDIKLEDSD
jgi:hypothetical protein